MMLYLDDDDVSAELSLADAQDGVERAFRLLAEGNAVNAPRQRSHSGTAVLNVMWALAPTEGVMGVKSYPVLRTDVSQGTVLTLLVYSMKTGELMAVVKADRLGQLRTGVATAVATTALARPGSRVLALYGTGFQAQTQLECLALAMPQLATVLVVGRSSARRDAFIQDMRSKLPLDIRAGEPESAARGADVIVTATGSAEPVLRGEWIRPGTHINAVGSNVATKREVDRVLLERSDLIVVDDRDVAAVDCGDLIANGWELDSLGTIGEVLVGRIAGRRSDDGITVFESQGIALLDVVCAARVIAGAEARGSGLRLA